MSDIDTLTLAVLAVAFVLFAKGMPTNPVPSEGLCAFVAGLCIGAALLGVAGIW